MSAILKLHMVCSNRFLLISLFLVAFTRWVATNRALMSANMMGCRTWEQDWLHAEPEFVSTLMDKLYGWQWNLSADNFHCKSHNHCKWIACSKCRNRRRKLREGYCVLHTLQIPCAMPGTRNENLPSTVPWLRGYREGKRGKGLSLPRGIGFVLGARPVLGVVVVVAPFTFP